MFSTIPKNKGSRGGITRIACLARLTRIFSSVVAEWIGLSSWFGGIGSAGRIDGLVGHGDIGRVEVLVVLAFSAVRVLLLVLLVLVVLLVVVVFLLLFESPFSLPLSVRLICIILLISFICDVWHVCVVPHEWCVLTVGLVPLVLIVRLFWLVSPVWLVLLLSLAWNVPFA